MSYFCINDNNQKMTKEEKENISMEPIPEKAPKKKRDHRGELNPHFGHIMTQESRDRISKSQSERYDMIRKLVKKGMQQPMTEDRVKQICKETIEKYFKKNLLEVRNNNKRPTNINL